MLIFVASVAMARLVHTARCQHEAAEVITNSGGWTEYSWQDTPETRKLEALPWVPRCLVRSLGADYFGTIISAGNISEEPGDGNAWLVAAGRLRGLERLSIGGYALRGSILSHIAGLNRLRELEFEGSEITDRGLANLAKSPVYAHLVCSGQISPTPGHQHLTRLISLEWLDLSDSAHITDEALTYVGALTNLRALVLTNCDVSDDGLLDLEGLTRLWVSTSTKRRSVTLAYCI